MAGTRHSGALELTWTDKDKALLSVGDGKYDYTFVDPGDYRVAEVRLLDEMGAYEADIPEERPDDLPAPTTDNLLITGDSMHVLDSLAKIPEYADEYLGKVRCVYIDPPFNTGQTFDNYDDNIDHSIWLTMLRDRLDQIMPLLAEDGSVWVHLDHVEVHRCRMVMDEVLGIDNFVAEVAWQKSDASRSNNQGVSIAHDVLLVYRKSANWRPNRMDRAAALDTKYTSPDGDLDRWFDNNPTVRGDRKHHDYIHAIQHPITGRLIYPTKSRHWAKSQDWILAQMSEYAPYELRDINDADARAEVCGVGVDQIREAVTAVMLAVPLDEAAQQARERYAAGNWPDIVLRSGGEGGIGFKLRIPTGGSVPTSWWQFSEVGSNRTAKSEIKALFPGDHAFDTPKPERLLQRIIHIATNPGDIVLDCFAGSGTTAAVAQKMGRRWVTSELLPETVARYTLPRLRKVIDGDDPGGITTTTTRIAAEGVELPDGVEPEPAQEFLSVLGKFAKEVEIPLDLFKKTAAAIRAQGKSATPALDPEEQKTLLRLLGKVGKATTADSDDEDSGTIDLMPEAARALRKAAKTRDETVTNWHGGGGFRHLVVRESMFTEEQGRVFLADWAVNGELAEAMCAQLGVRYAPEGIFAAAQGKTRYVVIDGLVRASTIASITDLLPEDAVVSVWATQVDPEAADALRTARKGSTLHTIPASVLDRYRRSQATRSPFRRDVAQTSAPDTTTAPAEGETR
ncbi:site-specific DNA-methyltransferase [Gordonia alkaliphila]|uniref:site-specific DNA-methyltransferase n=1 Tax=Gordonia alkaliphila TaxID=1053547 RepID=UPI001FF1B9BF|nr:site-specific DNA-methyltransferase [Gordonia alkaliphila]MCK0441236.1 site-specific DNA-methyltransferase [Gordonia alkaliphila]